jgi:predicted negative regulator of RcsB-dependent stress response
MVKILSGLVAAIVIAVGGFFGFQFYTQHRIANEVDAALEQAAKRAAARSRSTC